MLFSSKVPLKGLIQWCRALHHGIDVGLSPVKVFRQQARSGPVTARPFAALLADRLEQGASLEAAFGAYRSRLPTMFVEMVAVGEQTGRLTEVFGELERHYEDVLANRKRLVFSLLWPGFTFVSAVLIVALLLFILGQITGTDGRPTVRPFGDVLIGGRGAVAVLAGGALVAAVAVGGYLFARENEAVRGKLEAFALNIPGLAGCFRAFALHRFSIALHMTAEAGLRADRSLKLAFRATSNEAYRRHADDAAKSARAGKAITPGLAGLGEKLFPADFIDAVEVGEETGRLAEVMKKQSRHYADEATRKLRILTMIFGGLVYALIGLFVIVLIFKIAMVAYIEPTQDAMNAVDDPDAWMRGDKPRR